MICKRFSYSSTVRKSTYWIPTDTSDHRDHWNRPRVAPNSLHIYTSIVYLQQCTLSRSFLKSRDCSVRVYPICNARKHPLGITFSYDRLCGPIGGSAVIHFGIPGCPREIHWFVWFRGTYFIIPKLISTHEFAVNDSTFFQNFSHGILRISSKSRFLLDSTFAICTYDQLFAEARNYCLKWKKMDFLENCFLGFDVFNRQ